MSEVVEYEIARCPSCTSTNYGLKDAGGCLMIGYLAVGGTVLVLVLNWLGALVGLHLWRWMTSSFPSIPTIARTSLVISLVALVLVLAIRKAFNRRFSGPRWVCGDCGYNVATRASSVGRGGKVALGVLLAVILIVLGFCGLGTSSGSSRAAAGTTTIRPPAAQALTGDWVNSKGVVYRFVASKGSYVGQIVGHSTCDPADITMTFRGDGAYAGTTALYATTCGRRAGSASITITVSADGKSARFTSVGCANCGVQSWTRRKS